MSDKTTDEEYAELMEVLIVAEDPEFKARLVELVKGSFVPFDLERLGKVESVTT